MPGALLVQAWSLHQPHHYHLRMCWKCRFSGSKLNLLRDAGLGLSNYFNKTSSWSLCKLMFLEPLFQRDAWKTMKRCFVKIPQWQSWIVVTQIIGSTKNIYYLDLYRKILPTLSLGHYVHTHLHIHAHIHTHMDEWSWAWTLPCIFINCYYILEGSPLPVITSFSHPTPRSKLWHFSFPQSYSFPRSWKTLLLVNSRDTFENP